MSESKEAEWCATNKAGVQESEEEQNVAGGSKSAKCKVTHGGCRGNFLEDLKLEMRKLNILAFEIKVAMFEAEVKTKNRSEV